MKSSHKRKLGLLIIGAVSAFLATLVGFLAHEVAAWLADFFVGWDWPRAHRLALGGDEADR